MLCDRYTDATYAYQGGGRGIDDGLIDPLATLAQRGLWPKLTILLDAPVGPALQRARARSGKADRIEGEAVAFFERVRERYLQRAHSDPDRICIVDAVGSVAEVGERIASVVARVLPS